MVEVTVDAKSLAKLPYDPNDIPPAVRDRAKVMESAFYGTDGKLIGSGADPAPENPEPPSTTTDYAPVPQAPLLDRGVQPSIPTVPSAPAAAPSVARPAPTPPPPPPPPLEDENSDTWRNRYNAMLGRKEALERTVGEMQEQMTQMGDALMRLQQGQSAPTQQSRRQPQPQPQPAPANFLTDADVQNYGPDLVDFAQRAAAQAVAPQLNEVRTENAQLRRQLAAEARQRLDQQVELAVPNYREVDRDPRWHRWLLGIDPFTGRVRQQLLNDAITAAEAPRVISFFRGFLREEAVTGHTQPAPQTEQTASPREPVIPLASLAAPGRPRPATGGETSLPLEKPIYTRADIKRNYDQHRRGAYVGREADWNRLEHDMIAAGREGRVR